MEGFRGGPESLLFGQIVSYSLPGLWHFFAQGDERSGVVGPCDACKNVKG